ncbi:MAG TPA: endonuclease/exonuclease/phosphatase family protein [Opitutaceae bacterium]
MFAVVGAFLHRWRRNLSRSEWAIRYFGLAVSEGTSHAPGLLLLQIDGLSRKQLERAMARGRMPFLRRLMRREGYVLHDFYPGLPTTTPAVQAELYYGVRTAVPAFSYIDRTKGERGAMYYPDWAKRVEALCAAQGEGLLQGGSSWSNIYTGGATQRESHFCAASIGLGDLWRTQALRHILLVCLAHLASILRIAGLAVLETFIAFWNALRGIVRGESPWLELGMVVSRVFVGIGLREAVSIGGKIDVARGLPIVHINFLGYDELAHRRGPGSAYAHWSLRGIDRAIRGLYREAHRSGRREYAIWIISDHGQEHSRPLPLAIDGGLERIVHDCLEDARANSRAWRRNYPHQAPPLWWSRQRHAQSWLRRLLAGDVLTQEERGGISVAGLGPVAHIYFAEKLDADRRLALARRIVTSRRVPGVLLRRSDGSVCWIHSRGETAVPEGVPAILPHPEPWRGAIAEDLARLVSHPDAGDLVALGWVPWEAPCSFACERGGHGGPGPEETHGFALLPPRTRLPEGTQHFIRPDALRAAARHHLGREALPALTPHFTTGDVTTLRVMTYNTHGCGGMDGRISPRRIARVIEAYAPDVVALQEIDLGRLRSRGEDQAKLIAHHLGMHVTFCPSMTHSDGHYGHALLSRWPIHVVRRATLPSAPRSWWPEARTALWARVQPNGQPLNIVTTHLGLDRNERVAQMQALLGEEWLGRLPSEEPAVLCGDFNFTPGSRPYQIAVSRLRDVQTSRPDVRPLATFTTAQAFARIDHIFLTPHFSVLHVAVPQTDLTRVASDHLPLLADLQVVPAAVETTMHTSR